MRWYLTFFSLAALALPFAGPVAAAPKVTLVPLPPAASRPQVAVDAAGTVHLVFAHKENRGDLHYCRYDPARKHFSAPVRVNSTPQCAAGFNLAVGKGGRVHVLIRPNARYSRDRLKRLPKFNDLKFMLYCRLNDAGTAFEDERDLSGETYGFEGVGAVVADAEGRVGVYWHGWREPGREPDRKIFAVTSADEGKTFSEPKAVSNEVAGACRCCSMQGALGQDGTVYLAYRDAKEGGNKDSYLLASKDGKAFTADLLAPWPLAGCPGSTYSLASGKAGVFVGYDTLGKVSFARAGPKAVKVTAPSGERKARAPALAANARGEVLFAWSEATARPFRDPSDLAWRLYDAEGKPLGEKHTLRLGVAAGSFSAAYATPEGDFVVFHDGPGAGK